MVSVGRRFELKRRCRCFGSEYLDSSQQPTWPTPGTLPCTGGTEEMWQVPGSGMAPALVAVRHAAL